MRVEWKVKVAMALFTDFLEEEAAFLISLPYRVGVWISHSDDHADTERDDEREQRALLSVLTAMANNKSAPFVAAIAQETLTYQSYWSQWGTNTQEAAILKDVAKAMAMVAGRMPEDNTDNFRKCLLHVAKTVAGAYGEFSDIPAPGRGILGALTDRVMGALGRMQTDPGNISAAEGDAIKKLRAALQA